MSRTLKKSFVQSLCILSLLCFFFGVFNNAFITHAANEDSTYIIDNANLFDESEEENLNQLASDYHDKWNISMIVLTTDNTNGSTSEDYANDYYDTIIFGSEYYEDNNVTLFIDMDNREVHVLSYEGAQERMTASRCYDLEEDLVTYLSNKDYNGAATTFFEEVDRYLDTEVVEDDSYNNNYDEDSYTSNSYTDDSSEHSLFSQLWFQIIIAFVIGGITIFIMIVNSGGRVTTNSYTYLDQGTSHLTGQADNYIRTTTTRTKKSSNSGGGNHSGRSGGGHSGTTRGGHSFSSGGGHKF